MGFLPSVYNSTKFRKSQLRLILLHVASRSRENSLGRLHKAAVMSAPLLAVPADESVLPVSSTTSTSLGGIRMSTESVSSETGHVTQPTVGQVPARRIARHTIGILLLLITVVLWTASNFLASVRTSHEILLAEC